MRKVVVVTLAWAKAAIKAVQVAAVVKTVLVVAAGNFS